MGEGVGKRVVYVCVRVCVCVCARARARACMHAYVRSCMRRTCYVCTRGVRDLATVYFEKKKKETVIALMNVPHKKTTNCNDNRLQSTKLKFYRRMRCLSSLPVNLSIVDSMCIHSAESRVHPRIITKAMITEDAAIGLNSPRLGLDNVKQFVEALKRDERRVMEVF